MGNGDSNDELTDEPTDELTDEPTDEPTDAPTPAPTDAPTIALSSLAISPPRTPKGEEGPTPSLLLADPWHWLQQQQDGSLPSLLMTVPPSLHAMGAFELGSTAEGVSSTEGGSSGGGAWEQQFMAVMTMAIRKLGPQSVLMLVQQDMQLDAGQEDSGEGVEGSRGRRNRGSRRRHGRHKCVDFAKLVGKAGCDSQQGNQRGLRSMLHWHKVGLCCRILLLLLRPSNSCLLFFS
jgi:hypothetical protein